MSDAVAAGATRDADLPPSDRWATRWLPVLALAFHLSTAQRYGVFRDELYYVACGAHLDFGYVDHPPFVALVARLAHELFGTSLLGLRLLPATGNAQMGATALVRGLTPGSTYYWSVQAVDPGFRASVFSAESSFLAIHQLGHSSVASHVLLAVALSFSAALTLTRRRLRARSS